MPNKETYKDILLHTEDYLSEIELKLKNRNLFKDALDQAQISMLSADEVENDSLLNKQKYERLYRTLEILEDVPKRELLRKFLTQIFQMVKDPYDPERHFDNVRSYVKIGELFDEDLISALISKLENHVRKEVKFLQMKEPKYLDNEICDLAIGSIQNLTLKREEPTQQQTYEIVLLYEIYNFRLSTLDDEQAWDFMAQTILEEAKTTKPS